MISTPDKTLDPETLTIIRNFEQIVLKRLFDSGLSSFHIEVEALGGRKLRPLYQIVNSGDHGRVPAPATGEAKNLPDVIREALTLWET